MEPSESVRRPQHEFRCLGTVSLRTVTGRALRFRTRKQLALFTLFVRRPGQSLTRDHLIDLLWSEDDLSRSRHSLSQSVSLINKMLGCEAIGAPSKDELMLRDGVVWSDVAEFERCAAQRRHRDARALWRGNLLEGLWVHGAPNFERWLEIERRRLLETMRRALHELLARSRSEGDWEEMLGVSGALLELDGLDEAAMLAQLHALTLLGRRTAALRRYCEFEAKLRNDVGAEPGPEMRDWARRQRAGGAAPAAGSAGASRVTEASRHPAPRPLYGRTAEFAALAQAWDAARGGKGGCVLLLGRAGIGKSALVAKLVDQVSVAGGAACVAHCFRTEKCVPFAPVSSLVRQMAELPGFVALAPVWISELGRLVPELRERFPGAPAALAVDDSARHRVCEAICRAGECTSYEQPLLLVVDNVQDADETTLALLHYYGRQTQGQRTLLVCVVRDEDDQVPEGGEFVEQARAQGFAQVQRVGPLEEEHLQRLAADVLAQRGLEAPGPIVQSLGRLARGNPLHAMELALAIPANDGRPTPDWLLGIADTALSAEQSFEQSASARLAALSAGARQVTAGLAVAARPLEEQQLLAVTKLAPAELASALFELQGAHLLRREAQRFAFAHDRYAAVASDGIPEDDRVRVHARLAAVLAESAARNPAARMEVAAHYERAGSSLEARTHAVAAAEFAGSVGAVNERAEALELVRRVSKPYDGEVAAALAACYLGLREFDRVDALCLEAAGEADLSPRIRGEFRYLEIAADQHSGRAPLSRTCAALEELLGPAGFGDFPHRNDAMTLLMRTADKTGDVKLVRATARAQRRADVRGGGRPSAHALFAGAYVFAKYYWPDRALPLLQRARAQAEADQNWELEHACREGLGVVLKQLGRFSESGEQLRYGLALARRTLNPHAQASNLVNLAVLEMAQGNYEAASTLLEESAQIDSLYPNWFYRVYRYGNQAELALDTGRIDEAAAKYRKTLDQAVSVREWRMSVASCAGLAMCAKESGDLEQLSAWTARLLEVAKGRERLLEDRWIVEAALAWHACLNKEWSNCSSERLRGALRELSRRDKDHWLRLELEAVRLEEYQLGEVQTELRRRLSTLAGSYHANGIVREAESRLLASASPR